MSQIDELLKLTTPDRSGQRPMSIGPWQGIVATAPPTFADRVEVIIPAFDETLRWGPARWTSRDGLSKPQVGDDALVILDDQREPWVVAWGPGVAPTTPTPSSTFTGDVTARDGAASETFIGATGPGGEAGIGFGNPADSGIWRSAANIIKTADAFEVNRALFDDSAFFARVGSETNLRMTVRADGRIDWGPGTSGLDTNLYRNAASTLKTDGLFLAVSDIYARHNTTPESILGSAGPAGEAGINLGSSHDTNLYRSAANVLKTDDNFIIGGDYVLMPDATDTVRDALTAVDGMLLYNTTRKDLEFRTIDDRDVSRWLPVMMGSNADEAWRCEIVNVSIDLPSRAAHSGGTVTITLNFVEVGDYIFLIGQNQGGATNARILSVRTTVISTANQVVLNDYNADSATVDPGAESFYFFIVHRS